MKHIAFFTPTLNLGGIPKTYINLAIAFRMQGYEVTYITSKLETNQIDFLAKQGIQYTSLNSPRLRKSFKGIVSIFRKLKVDYIISGPPFCTLMCFYAKFITRHPVKIISYIHAYLNNDLKDDGLIGRLIPKIFKYLYPKSYRIITVSNHLKQYAIEKFHLPPEKIFPIYNLVINDVFFKMADQAVPQKFQFLKNQKFIISIGRLRSVKGYDVLIKSFKNVLKKHPSWKLVLVGCGELEYVYKCLVEKMGIAKSVVFTGGLDNPYALLKSANLFVSSSLSEGLGNVIIESLALKVPVVATKTNGAIEVLQDGKFGIIAEINDIDSLTEAILLAIDNNNKPYLNDRWRDFESEKIVSKYEKYIFN